MGVDHTEPEVPVDPVGRRVVCGEERATVRYVGPVPPTTGLWFGVEWDNPERGKHDGTNDGVQYFTCRHYKGGSFIRPAKASFGMDFLTAVRQVYQDDVVQSEHISSKETTLSDCKVWVKGLVRLEQLKSVLLNCREVNGPGADGEIRKTTPNIQWLDLSKTLLSCWDDVAAITQQLDKLERLCLSYNRMTEPSDPLSHSQAFCSLRVLVLNNCDLVWPQILRCAIMWPQLEDLSVEENNITELQRPEGALQSLKCLNLSNNPLVQDSVLSLSALPRLEQLNLSNTSLTVIPFEDVSPGAMFPALENLILDNNNISEWCVVDELAKLPRLSRLSCRGNRLKSSDGNPKTANQMIIAKLEQLLILNGSQILPEERRGAELDYIKMFGEEWLKAGGESQTSTQFTCQHPRYQKLITKYGAPDSSELKKQQPSVLKNQLLNITFVFPDHPDRRPIVKKLPATMDVHKVKGLLYRLLKVPAAGLSLTYTTPKRMDTEFEMNSDLKTLQFYSITDGDQVLVRWS
ncbi:tubulin-specific chaperone E [Parambassis ranga]|uniref:Tubulin-specific chaperone E n=1 Tax=Parambassis ranga TaxID=210632 RepID=A0A6P7IZ20_9TELE|nr:tubulin-specific chaperone E [Parambassis ranga]